MCGIMGYIGSGVGADVVMQGLKRLEYRGYDSAGIAVLDTHGKISTAKAEGKLSELKPLAAALPKKTVSAIGHTRWATHGPPVTRNAHPHVAGDVALVHNGIIENYQDLKVGLESAGVKFVTETDTEVVLHLLCQELLTALSVSDAIIHLTPKLKGAFSLGIMVASEPNALYLVKKGSPLVVGLGKGENYFGSDATAIVEHTQQVLFLEDGQFARVSRDEVSVFTFDGSPTSLVPQKIEWSIDSVEKQGFAHYMLKEINEQPTVIRQLSRRLVDSASGRFNFAELGIEKLDVQKIKSVNILACGTAYLSGLIGKYAFESVSKIPTNVELASEFRYRDPYVDKEGLTILVSQSGETADTLECAKYSKSRGSETFGICNVKYSSITREASGNLMMEAGPEIGVASTKAFSAMVLSQYLLACAIAEKRGIFSADQRDELCENLRELPAKIDATIAKAREIKLVAEKYYGAKDFLFIGRGEHYPIALEGALKLKEISYIHAEGYAAGELKHGPIALVDQQMPVVALAPNDLYYEKVISNIEQVTARLGRVIGVGVEGDHRLADLCDDVVLVPRLSIPALQSIVSVIPLQLFSYYVALLRGTDVDQPRNLAKSVTVE